MVDAVPERQVPPLRPLDVEPLGFGEATTVMVGGGETDDDLRAGRDRVAADLDDLHGVAECRMGHGGVVAEQLLDGGRDPVRIARAASSSCSGWSRSATTALPMNVVVVS